MVKHILSYATRRLLQPHPIVVILRPSATLLVPPRASVTFLIGYIQLLWLGFNSALFGSTVLGSMFWVLFFVGLYVTAIAIARGLGIVMCWLLENWMSVYVIEYDSPEEQAALKLVICHIEGLVESQTGHYQASGGYIFPFRSHQCSCHILQQGELDPHNPSPSSWHHLTGAHRSERSRFSNWHPSTRWLGFDLPSSNIWQ